MEDLRREMVAREQELQGKIDSLSEQLQRYAYIRADLESEVKTVRAEVASLQAELRRTEEGHMAQVMELTTQLRETLQRLDESETLRVRLEGVARDREARLHQCVGNASSIDAQLRDRVTFLESRSEDDETLRQQLAARSGEVVELGEALEETRRLLEETRWKLQAELDSRPLFVAKGLVVSGLFAYFEQRDPKLQRDILGTLCDTLELSEEDDLRLRRYSRSARERQEVEQAQERQRTWGQLADNFVGFLASEADGAQAQAMSG